VSFFSWPGGDDLHGSVLAALAQLHANAKNVTDFKKDG
jgi:hypothetical protein